MMKMILLFVFTSSAFGFSDQVIFDIANTQTSINEQILHNETQKEIESNTLSTDSLKLIRANKQLSDDIETITSNDITNLSDDCDKDKSGKKKKKKVIKTKTKKNYGWEIVASAEVNTSSENQNYTILEQQKPTHIYNNQYKELTQATNIDELQSIIRLHTKDLNDEEYLSYLSEITSRLPYNDTKAQFDQDEQHVDSLFSMLKEDFEQQAGTATDDNWGGICGDIHFATAIIGETARPKAYEYFTASYAMNNSQHVYSFAVSKDNPDKVVVINYGTVQISDNNTGIESALVKSKNKEGSFNNIGGNIRIYKHSGTGLEKQGKAEHVATLPTSIGTYLEKVALEDYQRSKMPSLPSSNTQEIDFNNKKNITKTKTITQDGNTTIENKSIDITSGIKLIHGQLNNPGFETKTDIFTVAVYRKKESNMTNGVLHKDKKTGSTSNLSLSVSNISQDQIFVTEDYIYMRLNYHKGIYKKLIEKEKATVTANGGFNINGDFISQATGATGDGNLQTYIGLDSNIKVNEKNSVQIGAKAEQVIGLKEQRSLYNLNDLPSNLQLTPNVINLRAALNTNLNPSININNYIGHTSTQVGSVTSYGSNFTINNQSNNGKHMVTIQYTKPSEGFNPNITSNLLPINENIMTGYSYQNGRVRAGGYFQYDMTNMSPVVGASLKVNLSKRK